MENRGPGGVRQVVLKWISRRYGVIGVDLFSVWYYPLVGCYEHGTVPSCSVKSEECMDYLSSC